jgi:hypothetical protein
MSEENDNDDSFISRLTSSGSEYADLLTQLTESEDDVDSDTEVELAFIKRPSSNDIAEEAHESLVSKVGEDNIPYEEPVPVILEAERQFSVMRDDIIGKLEDIKRKEEESVSGAKIDTMLYIIDEEAGKTGKFTLFGGAESLVYNTAEKNGWHQYEAELVYEANRLAAKENNLHRHLLLDTVIIVPNSRDLI